MKAGYSVDRTPENVLLPHRRGYSNSNTNKQQPYISRQCILINWQKQNINKVIERMNEVALQHSWTKDCKSTKMKKIYNQQKVIKEKNKLSHVR